MRFLLSTFLLASLLGFWLVVCQDVDSGATNSSLPSSSTTERTKTFQDVENKVKSLLSSAIKKAIPQFYSLASEIDLSPKCMSGMLRLVVGIQKMENWAISMLDAEGKPTGLLRGTLSHMGDYDECLGISAPVRSRGSQPAKEQFRGQYCTVKINTPHPVISHVQDYYNADPNNRSHFAISKSKTIFTLYARVAGFSEQFTFYYGLCIPSSCNVKDIEQVLKIISNAIGYNFTVHLCESTSDETHLSMDQKAILAVMGTILGCVFCGTLWELISGMRAENNTFRNSKDKHVFSQFLLSFSLYSNWKKAISTKCEEDVIIRTARGIIVAIVYINLYNLVFYDFHPYHFNVYGSVLNLIDMFDDFVFAAFSNLSCATCLYFFLLGVLITYRRLKDTYKNAKIPIKFTDLLIKPYIRFIFLQLLAISFVLLSPLVGSGPLWHLHMDSIIENCKKRWWTNLLFISNFWNGMDSCLYHMIPFSLFMQYSVLALFLLIIRRCCPSLATFIQCLLIVGGTICVGILTYIHQLPGSLSFGAINAKTLILTFDVLYTKPYSYIEAFSTGLLVGIFLAKYKDSFNLNRVSTVIGWTVAVSGIVAEMGGLYHHKGTSFPVQDRSAAAVYSAFSSIVWNICITWILFSSSKGYGGFIYSLLASKISVPMWRLCPLVYVVGVMLIGYNSANVRNTVYMSQYENIKIFFAIIVAANVVAISIYATCQVPLEFLISLLFNRRSTRPRKPLQHVTTKNNLKIATLPSAVTPTKERKKEAGNSNVQCEISHM